MGDPASTAPGNASARTATSPSGDALTTNRSSPALAGQEAIGTQQQNATTAELRETLDKLKATSDELDAARDHVFRLQPQRADLTESEAKDSFNALYQAVRRLVRSRLKPALDALSKGRLHSCRPVPDQAEAFQGLVREAARSCHNVVGADEYQVTAVVMEFLDREVFGKPPCFVSAQEMGVLRKASDLLFTLRDDYSHCRTWRSEALAAFKDDGARKGIIPKHIEKVTTRLCLALSAVFDLPDGMQTKSTARESARSPPRDSVRGLPDDVQTKSTAPESARSSWRDSVRDEIVEPAVKLANDLELATSIYSFQWPPNSPSRDLGLYECLDLATGKALTQEQSQARQGRWYLFEVAPALVVQSVNWPGGRRAAEARTLCEAVVLVQSDVKEKKKGSGTVMAWLATARSSHNLRGKTHSAAAKLHEVVADLHLAVANMHKRGATKGSGSLQELPIQGPGSIPNSDDFLRTKPKLLMKSQTPDGDMETRTTLVTNQRSAQETT